MGRVLGVDYGRVRVGLAISDRDRSIASPLLVYQRRGARGDELYFAELVREERVERIVVGLPIHLSGAESGISVEASEWGKWLARVTGCRVVARDERFTTREAEERMREVGLNLRRDKGKRDMFAAQILLQEYLDAGCPDEDSEARGLDDEVRGGR